MKTEVNNQTPSDADALMRRLDAKVEYTDSTISITFLLNGDREVFTEDGFATWVEEKYGESAFHEWVMNVICKEFDSIIDGHEMTNEEYDEQAEEIYNRHA